MFAQESVMGIKKEREAFERLPLAELAIESEFVFYNEETNSYWPNEDFCPSDAPETMNFAWEAWQAAKAQAVQEGFVVVPKEPTDKTIAHMINTPIEVNLLCDHADTFLSEGEAYIAYKAMIEAQEPAND